jgi:hypothetical protein
MLQRILALALAASLSSSHLYAQSPDRRDGTRVRVTGSQAFEIPGVVKIDSRGITGSSVTTDETTVRVVSPQTGQLLVILKPGVRTIARATAVNRAFVTLFLEGSRDSIAMPLSSIGKLEISKRRSGVHAIRGILLGAGTFYGAMALIFFGGCGLDCSDAAILPPIAAGIAVGMITGRPHETWQSVPSDWLLSNIRLQPSAAAAPETAAAEPRR